MFKKEKGGRRPPLKIILCFCLDFHWYYYVKAIKQLIARLVHRMSFLLHLLSQRFPLKRIGVLYKIFQSKTTFFQYFLNILLDNHLISTTTIENIVTITEKTITPIPPSFIILSFNLINSIKYSF